MWKLNANENLVLKVDKLKKKNNDGEDKGKRSEPKTNDNFNLKTKFTGDSYFSKEDFMTIFIGIGAGFFIKK